MTYSQMRVYNRYQATYKQPEDFITIVRSISPLTRVGALCFVFGKLMGILALPAAFIPSLGMFVVPLVIIWGTMVVTTIVLCSVDHYRKKKAEHREAENRNNQRNSVREHTGHEAEKSEYVFLEIGTPG